MCQAKLLWYSYYLDVICVRPGSTDGVHYEAVPYIGRDGVPRVWASDERDVEGESEREDSWWELLSAGRGRFQTRTGRTAVDLWGKVRLSCVVFLQETAQDHIIWQRLLSVLGMGKSQIPMLHQNLKCFIFESRIPWSRSQIWAQIVILKLKIPVFPQVHKHELQSVQQRRERLTHYTPRWLDGVVVRTLDLRLLVAGKSWVQFPAMSLPGYFWDWLNFAGKPSWYITITQVNLSLQPSGLDKSSTIFCWGKGSKVATAGWQVTLCDPIWIFYSAEVISMNCYIHLTLLVTLLYLLCAENMSVQMWYSVDFYVGRLKILGLLIDILMSSYQHSCLSLGMMSKYPLISVYQNSSVGIKYHLVLLSTIFWYQDIIVITGYRLFCGIIMVGIGSRWTEYRLATGSWWRVSTNRSLKLPQSLKSLAMKT